MMATAENNEVTPMPDVIRLSEVAFAWPGGRDFRLTIPRLSIERGARVLLIGPSGSGKTTLLNLLCGIGVPSSGAVEILGTLLASLSSAARDRFRAEHIGVIFQMFNLLPYGSAIDNVVLPLSFAPRRRQRASEAGLPAAEAARLLAALDLAQPYHRAPAATLSIGQQQRVAAARALIGTPEILIADEPTSALDRPNQDRFLDLLFAQIDAAGTTLIMVSHDEALSSRFTQTIALTDIVGAEPAP
jgi:putative ABC transport system ATP-binding protein